MTQEEFIKSIAKIVQKYAPQYNIKVCSPIIAQAVLESASGTSELARNANNFFGLKYRAGRCPTACGVYNKIGSEQNKDGSYISSAMQWMKFPDMESGVKGYFDFVNVPTYANLKGVADPKQYLENIKADGYATSLNYVQGLTAVIDNYNLTQYDIIQTGGKNTMEYKVAIDAGHGSNTAGKRTPDGYREHWINVRCANYFNEAMNRCGIKTVNIAWNDTNATDDADIALTARQQMIKNAKCNISVSWHANAHGDGKSYTNAQGIETLIHNSASQARDSAALASKVQNYLSKGTKQSNRGVKRQTLAMCNCPAMGTNASILIEIGFMTNEHEARLMKTDAFCLECAEEAAQGVCEYLGVPYVEGRKPASSAAAGAYVSNVPKVPSATPNAYSRTQFIKEVQSATGAKPDGIAGNETLSKTVTISKAKNNRHAVVKPVQKYLNSIGYNCGTADGVFGSATDAAVKSFQKSKGCVADGEITKEGRTWRVLLGLN